MQAGKQANFKIRPRGVGNAIIEANHQLRANKEDDDERARRRELFFVFPSDAPILCCIYYLAGIPCFLPTHTVLTHTGQKEKEIEIG